MQCIYIEHTVYQCVPMNSRTISIDISSINIHRTSLCKYTCTDTRIREIPQHLQVIFHDLACPKQLQV